MHKDAIDISLLWVILAGDLVPLVRLAQGLSNQREVLQIPHEAGFVQMPLGCREEDAGFLAWFGRNRTRFCFGGKHSSITASQAPAPSDLSLPFAPQQPGMARP